MSLIWGLDLGIARWSHSSPEICPESSPLGLEDLRLLGGLLWRILLWRVYVLVLSPVHDPRWLPSCRCLPDSAQPTLATGSQGCNSGLSQTVAVLGLVPMGTLIGFP